MWRTLVLAAANVGLSLTGTLTGLPGLDLTPVAMIMIARGGENVFLGAALLTVSYMITKPSRFAWVWLQVPTAILVGYIAIWQGNLYLPILAYHAVSVLAGIVLGAFSGRYVLYTAVNLGLNLAVVRVYGLVT